jgi:hypothetical protein
VCLLQDRRSGENACAAAGSTQVTAPCSRNALVLERVQASRMDISTKTYHGELVRFGQKVRVLLFSDDLSKTIGAMGAGTCGPLYLFSNPVSTTNYAKGRRHQVAGFSTNVSHDSVFEVVCPDPAQRTASEGIEVMAGVGICLKHCATNALLELEVDTTVSNEFGTERLMSFHTEHGNGKRTLLVHESAGRLTRTLPPPQLAGNVFRFLAGTTLGKQMGGKDGCGDIFFGNI